MPHKFLAAAILLLIAGCGSLPSLRSERAAAVVAPNADVVQAAQLNSYINALQLLVQGSPTEQAEVFADARAGYEQAKQGPAALRYALLLAAPSHPSRDTTLAQRLLRETLARPELLSVTERALAIIELQRVDTELKLTTENERLVADAQRERERQRTVAPNTAVTRRLQAEEEENMRLRKALEEARAKLDAITQLFRSPPANEGRNP
jgi:hypothetical protein